MRPVRPFDVRPLFVPLHGELVTLLRSLSEDDWQKPTVCAGWQVRDVAAHLVDGDLRRLSIQRDEAPLPAPPEPIEGYGDLVAFLNELNAQWVTACRRLSPRVLTDLAESAGGECARFFAGLELEAPALFPVAWAGEESSRMWFDLAREYTEKWHHQQQIRDAVGAAPLTGRRWLHPVLDAFVRGLPHAYRDLEAAAGARVGVTIEGEAGGAWTLVRETNAWHLFEGAPDRPPAASVRLGQDDAWRLFTKGLSPEAARPRLAAEGDRRLAEGVLLLLAVMA